MSYSRLRSSNPDEMVDFELKKPVGEGGFGFVCEIAETAYQPPMQVVLQPKRHERVAKRMRYSHKYGTHEKFIAAVEKEYDLSHLTPHLHIKPLVKVSDNEYILIMKKIQGSTLQDIIHKLNKNRIQLTARQYLSLMIEMVRADQIEADDCKIIHRDLKHANLMADLRNPNEPKVNMLDYGCALTKEKAKENKDFAGTRPFMAPEVYFDLAPCSEQSDIFSLGIIILALTTKNFNAKLVLKNKQNIREVFSMGSFWDGYDAYPYHMRFRDELRKIKPRLKKVITTICDKDPQARKNLNLLEERLLLIRLELDYPHATSKEMARLQGIQKVALDIRHTLKQSVLLQTANKRICGGLVNVPDVRSDINEFLTTLGIKTLYGSNSHDEIRKRLNDIAEEYTQNCANLAKIIRRLTYSKKSSSDSKRYLSILKHKQEKYSTNDFSSYEGFIKASKKIAQLIEYAPYAFKRYFPKAHEESVLYEALQSYAEDTKNNAYEYKLQKREKTLAQARGFFNSKLSQLSDLRATLEGLFEIHKKRKPLCLLRPDAFTKALHHLEDQSLQFNALSDETKFFTKEQYENASQKISELLSIMRGIMQTLDVNYGVHNRAAFFGGALPLAFMQREINGQVAQVEERAPGKNIL